MWRSVTLYDDVAFRNLSYGDKKVIIMKNESAVPAILLAVTLVTSVIATFKVYSFVSGGETSIIEAFLWGSGAVLSIIFTGEKFGCRNRK